jgi:hypothetical protein
MKVKGKGDVAVCRWFYCKRFRLSGNLTITPKGRIINSYLLTTQIVYIHIMGTVISHRLTMIYSTPYSVKIQLS